MKNENNILFANMDGYRHMSGKAIRFFRNFKYAKQRVVRGYADCDTWNFASFLRKVFADGLVYLSEINHGYPDRYGSAEKWEKELLRISGLVRELDEFLDEFSETHDERKNEVCEWLKENFDDLWD